MNKPDLLRCFRLLDDGLSLLTVGDDKTPNFAWKKNQDEILDKKEFERRYNYAGGILKRDGAEIVPTNNVGIITGFNYLEVIDVDLKVINTAKSRLSFWNEYINTLEENILDFKKKFVIYRTKNEGYHILYRSKLLEGNKKIASLKGSTQAVIETRGKGGYVFVYDGNNVTDLTYSDIDFVSDNDRKILWDISRLYNYEDKNEIKIEPKVQNDYRDGLTPWDDYNMRNSVIDIVSNELEIVGQHSDKYLLRRFGATSPHSGYVYKDNGFMYLFSTGTIYPAEKVITPFVAYTIKHHAGNYSESAKQAYRDGYGERKKPAPVIEVEKIEIPKQDLVFPVEIFPENIQKYISISAKTLNHSVDYMGCSLLWLLSIMVGNSIQIEVKKGWIEAANIWIAIVGKAGLGKTPSINQMVFPLTILNSREIKKFIKDKEKYDHFKSLDKQEQELTERVAKPVKSQFIVNDITLEALVELHEDNKNGIGVLKDELAGWFKDMNKYRQGSDLEHWLSSWSGKEINLNRKTAKSNFVERAFIPVLGGIQPNVLTEFYTDANKDNGFLDRMLFSYPDLDVEPYNEAEMNQDYLNWYCEYIQSFYSIIKTKVIKYRDDDEIEPVIAKFTDLAKIEWVRIFNEITGSQNSDSENEYMKSMLPKQKSYIPRFALLINTLASMDDASVDAMEINEESVLKAEQLSKYFIAMAKKIKVDNKETNEVKKILRKAEAKSVKDQVLELIGANPEINKSKLAEIVGVSRKTIHKYLKETK